MLNDISFSTVVGFVMSVFKDRQQSLRSKLNILFLMLYAYKYNQGNTHACDVCTDTYMSFFMRFSMNSYVATNYPNTIHPIV